MFTKLHRFWSQGKNGRDWILCYFNSMPIYGALVYSQYWPMQVGSHKKHEKNLFSILQVFITMLIENKIKAIKVINFYSKYRVKLKDNPLSTWL